MKEVGQDDASGFLVESSHPDSFGPCAPSSEPVFRIEGDERRKSAFDARNLLMDSFFWVATDKFNVPRIDQDTLQPKAARDAVSTIARQVIDVVGDHGCEVCRKGNGTFYAIRYSTGELGTEHRAMSCVTK